MRDRFIANLVKYLRKNKNTYFLTGDLGFGVIDNLSNIYPKNVINVGVSEQNMIGVAAGLASRGAKVIVYSIGNFSTLRCLEQIRNDVCYHNFDVNIVSVGAGFSYGVLGVSHHATEDIGIFNTLPNIHIYSPSTLRDVDYTCKEIFDSKKPSFIRLDKSNSQSNGVISNGFNIRKSNKSKVCIVSTGGIIEEIDEILEDDNFKNKISICSIYRIKPFNKKKFINFIKNYENILTLEEHQENGGLNSIITNLLYDNNLKINLSKFAIQNKYSNLAGDQKYLRKLNKINSTAIKKKLLEII